MLRLPTGTARALARPLGAAVRRLRERLSRRDESVDPGDTAGAYTPIEDYAIIGDGLTAALVSRAGSIDWACFPRFDSPSLFAAILDDAQGGRWRIRPSAPFTCERHYIDDTNVLRTVFATAGGRAELVDFMPAQPIGPERLGDSSIVRIVRGLHGSIDFDLLFDPRFDYARRRPEWNLDRPLGAQAIAGEESLTLSSDIDLSLANGSVSAHFRIGAGQEARFVAAYRDPPPLFWGQEPVHDARRWQDETEQYWRNWIARCTYSGTHEGIVRRSALALKLLDYAPTGAIIAAPTASLPEHIGGHRNWDYRYCWLRDAGFILTALYHLGYYEEGEHFLTWILDCTRDDPAHVRVMYRVDGTDDLAESHLDHLEGYRGSRPVRIGNAAAGQYQLDAYGEILDAAWLLQRSGGSLSPRLCEFLGSVVEYVCDHWREPDAGIWEVRTEARQFVYSKMLCWLAVDRGIRLTADNEMGADSDRWLAVRDEIAADIAANGVDPDTGGFTQAYDTREVDASLIALGLRGFVEPGDSRMSATIAAIERDLRVDGLLLRYPRSVDDGVGGPEGAFLLCSFWLAQIHAESDRLDEATALFDTLCEYGNDVGLFGEQFDPASHHHLGNFPQGLTHVALVNAAVAIERARHRPH